MKILQRVVLVMVFFTAFQMEIILSGFAEQRQMTKQWEKVQIERFLDKICRTGKFCYEDYIEYSTWLYYSGSNSRIQIEEYQKWMDRSGNVYKYLITWDEIQETILENGEYKFEKGNIVHIFAGENYYGIIVNEE